MFYDRVKAIRSDPELSLPEKTHQVENVFEEAFDGGSVPKLREDIEKNLARRVQNRRWKSEIFWLRAGDFCCAVGMSMGEIAKGYWITPKTKTKRRPS